MTSSRSFQKSVAEDARKFQDNADEFASNLEQDYKNRIAELTSRIDSLLKENARLKADVAPVRDKYRELENEYNSLLRRLEEKGRPAGPDRTTPSQTRSSSTRTSRRTSCWPRSRTSATCTMHSAPTLSASPTRTRS